MTTANEIIQLCEGGQGSGRRTLPHGNLATAAKVQASSFTRKQNKINSQDNAVTHATVKKHFGPNLRTHGNRNQDVAKKTHNVTTRDKENERHLVSIKGKTAPDKRKFRADY